MCVELIHHHHHQMRENGVFLTLGLIFKSELNMTEFAETLLYLIYLSFSPPLVFLWVKNLGVCGYNLERAQETAEDGQQML